jgi:hypothetical protein
MREMIMKASEIKELTVACLQQAVTKMMAYEWHKEVAKLPDDKERNEAMLKLTDCQEARLALENAQLVDISNKLEENDTALKQGRDELNRALEKLDKVKIIVAAVNSLLSIVSKIVTI